eukprot:354685-Hanusia_phi.AAC.1
MYVFAQLRQSLQHESIFALEIAMLLLPRTGGKELLRQPPKSDTSDWSPGETFKPGAGREVRIASICLSPGLALRHCGTRCDSDPGLDSAWPPSDSLVSEVTVTRAGPGSRTRRGTDGVPCYPMSPRCARLRAQYGGNHHAAAVPKFPAAPARSPGPTVTTVPYYAGN